jgi:hypothetical protein
VDWDFCVSLRQLTTIGPVLSGQSRWPEVSKQLPLDGRLCRWTSLNVHSFDWGLQLKTSLSSVVTDSPFVLAQAAFIFVALSAGVYFIFRRKIDPLAIAFGSCLIYFVPGFFGVAEFSYGQGLGGYSEPIVPGAYAALIIVLAALVSAALVIDHIPVRQPYAARIEGLVPGVLLAIVLISAALSIRNVGVYFLCPDKTIVLEKIDVWYNYASLTVPFCVATAYALRQRAVALAGCAFLLADLYIGFRVSSGITIIAVLVLEAGESLFRGWIRSSIFICAVLTIGASLFMVKHLIAPVKYAYGSYCESQLALDRNSAEAGVLSRRQNARSLAMWQSLHNTMENLTHSRFYFLAFIGQAEPFVIQSTLNEVVRKNFKTDSKYLLGQILAGLPLGESLFGLKSSSVTTFNDRFQHVLFPDFRFGMANNPWAQAYAANGLWMVALFAAGYAAVSGYLTFIFNRAKGALKAGAAVIAAWIGFYFQRNDLFIEAILIKHVVYIFVFSLLVAWLIAVISRGVSARLPNKFAR